MSTQQPKYIKDLETLLRTHSALVDVKKSLHVYFNRTDYGCVKDYPVAIVHEAKRIKEEDTLTYFKQNHLLDEKGTTYEEYPLNDLERISINTPKYIQNVGFILASTKEIPHPTFTNKFKHDYWKKIQSVKGLEAVIDISALTPTSSACEAENTLRAIIRKRKEVHQLKKITFVWIVEITGVNPHIDIVMKHYFEENVMTVKNGRKTYYAGWSTPLQSINMRYFVCPPE